MCVCATSDVCGERAQNHVWHPWGPRFAHWTCPWAAKLYSSRLQKRLQKLQEMAEAGTIAGQSIRVAPHQLGHDCSRPIQHTHISHAQSRPTRSCHPHKVSGTARLRKRYPPGGRRVRRLGGAGSAFTMYGPASS